MQGGSSPYVFGSGALGFANTGIKTSFTAGELVPMEVIVTAHHGGRFEFRLQDVGGNADPSGALWEFLPLLAVESFSPSCDDPRYCGVEPCVAAKTCAQVPMGPYGNHDGRYKMDIRIPDITCDHCVLQWKYITANSCGGTKTSCDSSEKFWNCADLQIIGKGAPTKAPTEAPTGPTFAPIAAPTQDPATQNECYAISEQATDSWCQTVGCDDPAYAAFCSDALRSPVTDSTTSPPSGKDSNRDLTKCHSVLDCISDEWCQSVNCDPVYSMFCQYESDTTAAPSLKSSPRPIEEPSVMPVPVPTSAFTGAPTKPPTTSPTKVPTVSPSRVPTILSTKVPTALPTDTSAPNCAPIAPYGQCGGKAFSGCTICQKEDTWGRRFGCDIHYSEWWAACQPCSTHPNAVGCGEFAETATPVAVPTKAPVIASTESPVTTLPNDDTISNMPTVIGFYDWTWALGPTSVPFGTTLSVAFSGWGEVDIALGESDPLLTSGALLGKIYLSIGGGNENGRLTAARLQSLDDAIVSGKLEGYSGICYDVEEGDTGLASTFATSFRVARQNGFKVLVTVSHSAPYGISDKVDLMNSFIANDDIDYLSPQLYTTGYEAANDYIWAAVPWSAYANSKATVIPSIVKAEYYADAQDFYANRLTNAQGSLVEGFSIGGYIQWKQPSNRRQ